MDCPHCKNLRQELSSAAEREARAILGQRSSWMFQKPAATEVKYETLQAQADESRRTQAHIHDLLEEHELAHHTAA